MAKHPTPIKIRKSKRGVFTEKARKAGMGVAAFAAKVLKKNSKYSAATKKQAAFAKGIAKASRKKGSNPRGRG